MFADRHEKAFKKTSENPRTLYASQATFNPERQERHDSEQVDGK